MSGRSHLHFSLCCHPWCPLTCASFTWTIWLSLLNPRPIFSMGSSLAVLVWYWLHQVSGYGLRSSPRPPRLPQHKNFGVTLTPTLSGGVHVDVVSVLGDRFFHQACAWSWRRFVSLSLSPQLSSFFTSFSVCHLVWRQLWSTSIIEPLIRHWWPSASPVAAVHWDFGIGDALHRAFSMFGRLCVVNNFPLALQTLPVSSGSVRPCKAHGPRPLPVPHLGHVGISLGSPPSAIQRWLSRGAIPRLDCVCLAAMVSDFHGLRVVVSSVDFFCAFVCPGVVLDIRESQLSWTFGEAFQTDFFWGGGG